MAIAETDLENLQSELRAWARYLVHSQKPNELPVLVEPICDALSITLKYSSSVPDLKAYLSIDRLRQSTAIVLPQKRKVSDFMRFCIAHELGHYFLISKFDLLPKVKSEYWQHETLCDDFARHLLAPDDLLPKRSFSDVKDASDSLQKSIELTRQARMPWRHFCTRISELHTNLGFFRCFVDEKEPAFKVVETSLGSKKGKYKQFGFDTSTGAKLQNLMEESRIHRNPRMTVLEQTNELALVVKRSMNVRKFQAAAVADASLVQPDVKIAIVALVHS